MFKRKAEEAAMGILFDDDYDYTQHLRERAPDGAGDIYLADPKDVVKVLAERGALNGVACLVRELPRQCPAAGVPM